MDFMKIIKSLELLLYELMVWLVFYPLTLWRSVSAPSALMNYADDELSDEDEDRYSDTLSPPIFLAITLGLVHLVELMVGVDIQVEGLLADDKNLIAFRLVAFSLFPLMMSLRLLRASGKVLDRNTLRPPFYAQCFLAAPFALGFDLLSIANTLGIDTTVALALAAALTAWYLFVQAKWFASSLEISIGKGAIHAVWSFGRALVIVVFLALVMSNL